MTSHRYQVGDRGTDIERARPGSAALRPVLSASLSSSAAFSSGRRPPSQPARTLGGLRCLWYDDRVARALASVDEFLHTPAAATALAEFCQNRRDGRAPVAQARELVDAVGSIAGLVRHQNVI